MRAFILAAAAAILALPATAQQTTMQSAAGSGKLPDNWMARVDRDAPASSVKFDKMGDGWHVAPGNAAVYWRDADKASGNYHATVKLTQTKSPMHPEGYGLVVGGSDLAGAAQKYTYFLVRGDGRFLIKKRDGASTTNVNEGWTENAAINKADANGKATNTLAIGVKGGKVSFTVNDKEVYNTDAASVNTDGNVGVRVNHNLDVHIADFAVHKS